MVANIDAIDTALTAILAGSLAAVLFAFDKATDLPRMPEMCALLMFYGSVLTSAAGYFFGLQRSFENRDRLRPRQLVPDIMDVRDAAVAGALKALVDVSEKNTTIRLYKSVLASTAVVFLIAGVVAVALARWTLSVVS